MAISEKFYIQSIDFICKLYFIPSLNIIIWHWTIQYGIIYGSFIEVNFFMVILPVYCFKWQVFCKIPPLVVVGTVFV